MSIVNLFHRERHALAYWVQWLLLQVFGPATQDRDSDPIEQLKRRYNRRPSP